MSRALVSLIPDDLLSGRQGATDAYRVVPIDQVVPNPEQPRTTFDPEELEALSHSITTHGVMSPLVVRANGSQYVLIAGERRLRASALAGLTQVPVIVRNSNDGAETLELALVENLQRADLDPVETALGFQRLIDAYGYTQEEVAISVGRDRSTVANALRLLKLPDFGLDALRHGQISAGHARALLGIRNPSAMKRVLARIVANNLSVRRTEEIVNGLKRPTSPAPATDRFEHATRVLERSLHAGVRIKPLKKGGGRIVIDYGSDEDLERLIHQLRKRVS